MSIVASSLFDSFPSLSEVLRHSSPLLSVHSDKSLLLVFFFTTEKAAPYQMAPGVLIRQAEAIPLHGPARGHLAEHAVGTLVVIIVFLVLTTLFTALRFYSRWLILRRFLVTEWLILATQVGRSGLIGASRLLTLASSCFMATASRASSIFTKEE